MGIKSLEELKKIREKSLNKVQLREHGEVEGEEIEVLVGMSTCGISSGARETLSTFIDVISKEGLENIKVIPVGCIGYCHSEPTVQINIPGQKPVLYGNVKGDKASRIIDSHIKNDQKLEELVLKIDFQRA